LEHRLHGIGAWKGAPGFTGMFNAIIRAHVDDELEGKIGA
jgi:hypothetical protein